MIFDIVAIIVGARYAKAHGFSQVRGAINALLILWAVYIALAIVIVALSAHR